MDESAKFSKTVVLQDKGADRQSVPILKNTSYVRISDPEKCLLFEDTYGRRYYLKDGYRITRMFAGDTGEKSGGTNEKNSLEEQPDGTMALKRKLEEFADSIDCLDKEIQQAKEQNMDVSAYQEQLLVRMLFTARAIRLRSGMPMYPIFPGVICCMRRKYRGKYLNTWNIL